MISRAAHLGGLWETGVKVVKLHLKKIKATYIYLEEFLGLVVQIEAVQKSRPLSPMSSDPNDLVP